jgi:hypothetical protein
VRSSFSASILRQTFQRFVRHRSALACKPRAGVIAIVIILHSSTDKRLELLAAGAQDAHAVLLFLKASGIET